MRRQLKVLIGVTAMLWPFSAGGAFAQSEFQWLTYPSADEFNQFYPQAALANEIEGTVTLRCRVVDSAGHVTCAVASEAPAWCGDKPDYAKPIAGLPGTYEPLRDDRGKPVPQPCGFGRAAVQTMEKLARADMKDGKVAIGAQSRVTLRYQLS